MISLKKALEQLKPTATNSYINAYKDVLSTSTINTLLTKGKKISNYFIENKEEIALLVGQVQSGKTATFSAVIAKHFDAGSNFVMITPSMDNILLNQTLSRMEKTFASSNIKIRIMDDYKKSNSYSVEKMEAELKNGKKIIVVLLKNEKRLTNMAKLINAVSPSTLFEKPLLIDDEGDQASFDDKNSKDPRAIFKGIVGLKESIDGVSMLTVTATPMAHILVDEGYKIKPRKAFYIEPGEGYCGAAKFADEDNGLVVRVNDKIDTNFFKGSSVIPESFNESLLSFFASSAFKHLVSESLKPTSMFIHVDRKVDNNIKMKRMIDDQIVYIQSSLIKRRKVQVDFIKDFISKYEELESFTVEQYIELVLAHMDNNDPIVVVGKDELKVSAIKALYASNNQNYIFVGSSMLQRGVTMPNLIHTYFTYRTEGVINADTVLQRARWFGYGKDPRFTKVFMSNKAADDFTALSETVYDIADKISYLEDNDLDFPEGMERSINIPSKFLRGTRESVVKNSRSFLSRFISNANASNSNITEELYKTLSSGEVKLEKLFMNREHKGIKYESFDGFIEWFSTSSWRELLCDIDIYKSKNDEESADAKNLADYIYQNKPSIYVALMSKKDSDFIERSETNGKVSLTSGHGTEDGYVGDIYWSDDISGKFENSIVIQIYKIKIKQTGETIYKPAIVLPKEVFGGLIHAID